MSVVHTRCAEVGGGMCSCRTTPSVLGHFKSHPFQDFSTACGAEWLVLNYWMTRKRLEHLPEQNICSYKVDSIFLLKVKGCSKSTLNCTLLPAVGLMSHIAHSPIASVHTPFILCYWNEYWHSRLLELDQSQANIPISEDPKMQQNSEFYLTLS